MSASQSILAALAVLLLVGACFVSVQAAPYQTPSDFKTVGEYDRFYTRWLAENVVENNPSATIASATGNVSTAVSFPPNFSSCGSANDNFAVHTVVFEPYPPVRGKNLVVTVSGNVVKPIQPGANIKITAKLFGGILPVWSKTVDVCAEAKICPIDLGERDLDFSTELPGNIPSVTLYLKIEGKNANGEPLSCFQGKFVPQ